MQFLLRVVCLGAAFSVLGCTPADTGPPLVATEGTVTLDGKALGNAVVTLVPSGDTRGQGGMGTTDAEGKFVIKSREDKPGAVAGTYRVMINKWVGPDGSDYVFPPDVSPMESNARELLPARYSDAERTTLTATVPAEGAKLEFKLVTK